MVPKIRTSAFLAIVLTMIAGAAQATMTVTSLKWEQSTGDGLRRLEINLDAAPRPDAIDVARSANGIELFLSDVALAVAIPPDVRRLEEARGVRLALGTDRTALLGVSISPARVTVTVRDSDVGGSSYRVGVGDVLFVSVYKNEDLTGEYTVSQEGAIKMPLIGTMPAAGSTEAELARRVAALLGKEFLVNPQVAVTVRTYQSQYVYVTGAVASSRRIALRPGSNLKDVLSEAGVALAPGQKLLLRRTTAGREQVDTLTSSDLAGNAAPSPLDGDVVTVQERDYFFIQGEVRRSGKVPLEPGTTLLRAISLAEGLTEWANRADVRIRRTEGERTSEIRVNLKRVEERKDADPELRAGDLILVRRRVF